jgi:hypothetical protein
MFRSSWRRLLLSLFRPSVRTIRKRPMPRRRNRPILEALEDRLTPATLTDGGTKTLTITLDNANEALQIASQGSSYLFNSTNNFIDGGVKNSADFSPFLTMTLTLNNLADYNAVKVVDGAAGTSVAFNDSGTNAYSTDFMVALSMGSAGVTFNKASDFSSNVLQVQTDGSISVASLATVKTGNAALVADTMSFTGTISAGATNTLTLRPNTNGTAIDLGTKTAGELGFTNAELNNITAGTLAVGDTNSGAITVSKAVNPANISTLNLTTNANISDGTMGLGGNLLSIPTVNLAAPNGTIDVNLSTSNITTSSSGNQFLQDAVTGTIGSAGLNAGSNTISLGSGTFALGGMNRIAASSILDVESLFQLKGFSETIGGLTGAGSVTNGAGTAATLTLDQAGTSTFSGTLGGAGLNDNNFGLTMAGLGSLSLTGMNTYTGDTNINAGTLFVNSPGSITSNVFANSGGTLGGSGTVNSATTVTVNNGGTLAPGTSPGIINTGSVSFAAGSNFNVELDGKTVGTQYDQLDAVGNVSLGNANLNISLGFTPAVGDAFNILDNDGGSPITGTFLGLPEGQVFAAGGQFFQITYQGGDGNDVVLTDVAPPDVTLNGTPGNDTFIIKRNGPNVDITLNGKVIYSPAFASLHSLTLNGLAGSDTLQVDLSGGNPIPVNGVTFNGGGQAGDALSITGGSDQGTTTYDYTTAHDGDVVMSNFGTITYTGLAPLSNTGTVTDAVYNLPSGSNTATLKNIGGGMLRLLSAPVTFEQTDFSIPTGSLTVNGGLGGDTITVNPQNIGAANLKIAGFLQITTDAVTTTGNVVLSATIGAIIDGNGAGTLNVTANDLNASAGTGIDLDTAVATVTAMTTGTGDINLRQTGAITLTNINTNDGVINVSSTGTMTATLVTANGVSRDVNLSTSSSDERLGAVSATGNANITAAGAIINNSLGTNITATGTSLTASTGIGSGNALKTKVAAVAAHNTVSGNIELSNTGALAIQTVGLVPDVTDSNGSVAITTTGDLTSSAAVTAGGTPGNVTLLSTMGKIALGGTVTAGSTGTVRLMSAGDITQSMTAVITGSALGAHSTGGNVVLDTASNAVGTFAAEADTAADVVRFRNSIGFATGQVPASGSFTVVTGVTTNAGRVTLCADTGTITIGTTGVPGSGINTGTGDTVRIQATAGGVGQTIEGAIVSNLLGVSATDTVNLAVAANTNKGLAINTNGRIDYKDTGDVTITSVSAMDCFTTMAAGVRSNNHDINLGIGGNLLLNDGQPGPSIGAGTGVARINAVGSVNQVLVDDTVVASQLGIVAGTTVTLCAGDNLVGTVAISANGLIEFRDLISFAVDTVDVPTPNLIGYVKTSGIVSSGGDINLATGPAAGVSLNPGQMLVSGSGNIRLVLPGGISGPGTISANQLGILSGGDVLLLGGVNTVNTLAVNPIGPAVIAVEFKDADALMIDKVAPGGNCGFTGADGIITNGGHVSLNTAAIAAGTLAINRPIDALTGVGDVRIVSSTATTDAVTQMAAGTILGRDLALNAIGNIALDTANNDITDKFAADNTGTGAFVHFNDTSTNGFMVDTVAPLNGFGAATGVTTVGGGDVALGDAQATAVLQINQKIDTTTAMRGTVRLAMGNAITQADSAAASITASDFGVIAGSDITLDGASTLNNVNGQVAVNNMGSGNFFRFFNQSTTGFTVGTVDALSVFPTKTIGITTTGNGDVVLADKVGTADLTIHDVINTASGPVRLQMGHAVSQDNLLTASVTAGDLGIQAGGNVTLDGDMTQNNVTGKFAANDTGSAAFVHFKDTSTVGFMVDTVTALSDFDQAIGVTTMGAGDVALGDAQTTAVLQINQKIDTTTATRGQVRLAMGNAITQADSANASITAGDFGVIAGSDITLDGASTLNNVNGQVAVNNMGSGNFFRFFNQSTTGFTVGTVDALSVFTTKTIGITTTGNGDVVLADKVGTADLTIQDVINTASGPVRLALGHKISQDNLMTASVTAGDLGITASGDVTLDGTNTTNMVTGQFAANDTGGSVHFDNTTGGGITVGSVMGLSRFTGANGVTTLGAGDIILTDGVSAANLQIKNVIASGTNVRLGFGGAVMQDNSPGASISAADLGITANGDVALGGSGTNNTAQVFAAQNQGAGKVVDFFDHASLTIGPVGSAGRFQGAGGVLTTNGATALVTTDNFTVLDEGANVDVIRSGSATTNITAASGAAVGNFTVDVEGQIRTSALATITGAQGAGVTNTFFLRPGAKSTGEEAVGNQMVPPNQCRDTLQLAQLLEALGNPNTANIALVRSPLNLCNGTFTFNKNALFFTDYKGFNLGGLSVKVTSAVTSSSTTRPFTLIVQLFTAASKNTPNSLIPINNPASTPLATVNGFIVSPVFANPSGMVGAPTVAVADLQGTPGHGATDIILANGAGAAPLVTVVDGTILATQQNPQHPDQVFNQAIISRFYAFDPRFQGGLNVAAGVLDNSGRASIVVAKNTLVTASQAFGSPNEVRIFSPGSVLSQTAFNNPRQLVPTAVFRAYPDTFLGGVRVAVGDVTGTNPIIVTAPGPGAALPVEVFDAHTLQAMQSFFPYGTGFSDGVFIAVANLQSGQMTNDILTGPGAGDPILEIFNGPTYTNNPNTRYRAFRSGTGIYIANNNFATTFNANTQIFGVSSVAFGGFSNRNLIRDILVGSGIGQRAVQSTVNLQQSDLNKTTVPPTKRSMFFRRRAPQGVNVASSH